MGKCPGQDPRNIKPEPIRCIACGYEAELFSDEVKVKCPRCAQIICRTRLPSCVDWCRYARECIGEEKWKMMKQKTQEE